MRPVFDSPLQFAVVGTLHRCGMASLRQITSDLGHDSSDRVRITLARLVKAGLVEVQGSSHGIDLWGLTDDGAARRDELIEALNGKGNAPRSLEARSRQATQV